MTDDLRKAIERVNDAQKAMNDAYDKGYRDGVESAYLNTDEVASYLSDLENQVRSFKERAIQHAVDEGVKTKDVAKSYGISSARISQIAPRRHKQESIMESDISQKTNVVNLQTNKLQTPKSESDNTVAASSQDKGSISISQSLRATIDDGLKQQMREQMRKKHGFKQK